MAADLVWMSTAMIDPRRLRPFTNDFASIDGKGGLLIDTHKRNCAGEPLGADAFPKKIWGAADRGEKP
jgi:hypothetical protein